jgi:hypothetical protein
MGSTSRDGPLFDMLASVAGFSRAAWLEVVRPYGEALRNRAVVLVGNVTRIEKGPDWENSTGSHFPAGRLYQ